MRRILSYMLAGFTAGAVNGIFGAGGGMLLVPLLTLLANLEEKQIFPASVTIILPICLVSLSISPGLDALPWKDNSQSEQIGF